MPQISVTVTKDELAGLHGKAGAATLSNYVRERLGLPALQRGRGGAARANDEATQQVPPEPAEQFLGRPLADWESGGSIQRAYEELINAPDADCPDCGAQPLQMHKKGKGEEPAHELSYESDDKPATIEGDFEPKGRGGQK